MLLNKKYLLLLLSLVFILSCADKSEKIPVLNYSDKNQMLNVAKKFYDENIGAAFGGIFDESFKESIIGCTEINNERDWGIKFHQLLKVEEELELKYETSLLEGSLKDCFIDKIKFPMLEYELIYYNSQGYFMGSGGGEIFSYIINFETKEVYYAHLVSEPGYPATLYISPNTKIKDVKNFFIAIFKKDYPQVRLVDEDISIE